MHRGREGPQEGTICNRGAEQGKGQRGATPLQRCKNRERAREGSICNRGAEQGDETVYCGGAKCSSVLCRYRANNGKGTGKRQSAIEVQNSGMKQCTMKVQSFYQYCTDTGPTMGQ